MQIMKLFIVDSFCRPFSPSLFSLNIFLSFVFWAVLSLLPSLCETKLHVKERTQAGESSSLGVNMHTNHVFFH